MGVIQNGSFISSYYGDQIDLLLAAMAQANPLPSGTNWVAFIDDCRAAQSSAEAAAALAEAWSAHPPYIGANGNFYVYSISAETFVDSGWPSRGEPGKSAYEAAQDGGYTATEAEFNTELAALPTYATDAADSANAASGSATAAAGSASSASGSATLAESWAVGGTNTRSGEDTNNAEYWSNVAMSEADRATIPPVAGIYNVVVSDRITGDKYAVVVVNGRLTLLACSANTDTANLELVDVNTGITYTLTAESGRIVLEEV